MRHFFKILFAISLLAGQVHARTFDGNEGPNGGDDISLEFVNLAKEVLREVESSRPELLKMFSLSDAQKQLGILKVVATDQPQYLDIDGHQQSVIAVNYPGASLVIIHIGKWNAIKKIQLKKALVFHEVLSLIGAESSGRYPISSAYLGSALSVSGGECALGQKPIFQAEAAGRFIIQHMPYPALGGHRIILTPLAEDTKEAVTDFAAALKVPKSQKIQAVEMLVWGQCNADSDPLYRFGYFCYGVAGVTVNFVSDDGRLISGSSATSVSLKHNIDGSETFMLIDLTGHPRVNLILESNELSCDI